MSDNDNIDLGYELSPAWSTIDHKFVSAVDIDYVDATSGLSTIVERSELPWGTWEKLLNDLDKNSSVENTDKPHHMIAVAWRDTGRNWHTTLEGDVFASQQEDVHC